MLQFSLQHEESKVADQVQLRTLVSTLCWASPALRVEPHREEHVLGRGLFDNCFILFSSMMGSSFMISFLALLLILHGGECT